MCFQVGCPRSSRQRISRSSSSTRTPNLNISFAAACVTCREALTAHTYIYRETYTHTHALPKFDIPVRRFIIETRSLDDCIPQVSRVELCAARGKFARKIYRILAEEEDLSKISTSPRKTRFIEFSTQPDRKIFQARYREINQRRLLGELSREYKVVRAEAAVRSFASR